MYFFLRIGTFQQGEKNRRRTAYYVIWGNYDDEIVEE